MKEKLPELYIATDVEADCSIPGPMCLLTNHAIYYICFCL